VQEYVQYLDDPAVRRFADAAQSVCDVFEQADDLPEIDFLRRLQKVLPLAYSLAHQMPDLFHHNDDEEEEDGNGEYESILRPWPQAMSDKARSALWKDFHRRIGQKLGGHNHIAWKFDPARPDEREIVDGELSQILADLYVALKAGLTLLGQSSDEKRSQGLWDLWFGMKHDWGWHLAQVFLPIHSLTHQHYDSIRDQWWANDRDKGEPSV
jgi:hypothetical protein